jgi:hypothetical protein
LTCTVNILTGPLCSHFTLNMNIIRISETSEIWLLHLHGVIIQKYVDVCLLGCNTVCTCR